jgi:hypothetical protein
MKGMGTVTCIKCVSKIQGQVSTAHLGHLLVPGSSLWIQTKNSDAAKSETLRDSPITPQIQQFFSRELSTQFHANLRFFSRHLLIAEDESEID